MTYLDVKLNSNQKMKYKDTSRSKFPSKDLSYSSKQDYRQKNNFLIKERALKQNSSNLSFKGSFFRLFNGYSKPISNYSQTLGIADKILSNVPSDAITKINKIIPNAIKIEGNTVKFKETGLVQKLLVSAVYPITQMPLDILNFALKSARKIPGLGNSKVLDNIYNSSFLSKNREKILLNEQIVSLQNIFEGASKLNFSKSENKEAFIKQVHAMFDPRKGNYSTAHERSLNRIVSGIIPAYFLANDAYNLSRCCDDNKDAAEKESKIRFKQELARVGSTAYIQLVLLNALSNIINSSMYGAVLSSTGITIFTELFSRKFSGKPVTFLNKKSAKFQYEKEYNEFSKKQEDAGNPYTYYKMPVAFKNQTVFASFRGNDANVQKSEDNKNKPPVTLSGILKYSAYSTVAGFALLALRKNSKGVDDLFNNAFRPFKNFYKKLAFKDLSVSKESLTALANRFERAGYSDIASAYKKIIDNTAGNEIDFGKQNTKQKPFVDFIIGPFKFVWKTLTLPYNLSKIVLAVPIKTLRTPPKTSNQNQILGDGIQQILDRTKELNDEQFKKFIDEKVLSSFYSGKSNYSNADLAILTKLFCSGATSYFLIADNYNMVMTKSKGEDKKGAVLKAKERTAQRISSIFYSTLFIDLFNNTFRKAYHASLLGMSAVTAMCVTMGEVFTRLSIGMPIREKTKAQIMDIENKNNSRDGLTGEYFRFMSRLTGKKVLSERIKKS